jgi:hypothetical protein
MFTNILKSIKLNLTSVVSSSQSIHTSSLSDNNSESFNQLRLTLNDHIVESEEINSKSNSLDNRVSMDEFDLPEKNNNNTIERTIIVGSVFGDLESASLAIKQYSSDFGFAVIKGNIKRLNNGEIKSQQYLCHCGGTKPKVGSSTKKTSCKWTVWLNRFQEAGQYMWKVSTFHDEHNHALVNPQLSSLISNNRFIPLNIKSRITSLSKAQVSVPMMELIIKNEFENVPKTWIRKDLYNYLSSIHSDDRKMPEALELMSAFQDMIDNDENFIRRVKTTGNVLHSAFWCSSLQKLNAEIYSDVVIFDPTYKTNDLGLPLACFLGVNSHGNTVVLACSLLGDETSETFIWVFERFKQVSSYPVMIFTDDDPSISLAVNTCFPNSIHRLCVWHLARNIVKNMAQSGLLSSFMSSFYAIQKLIDIAEFEQSWIELKERLTFQTKQEPPYLNKLYDSRQKWAKCYFSHAFDAGMNTTQRGEGFNAWIKRIVGSRSRLVDVMRSCVEDTGHNEKIRGSLAEIKSALLGHKLAFGFPFEAKWAKCLTLYAYNMFREQLSLSITYISDSEGRVHHPEQPHKIRYVDIVEGNCTCGYPASFGLPCRHIFNISIKIQLQELPDRWVNTRWLNKSFAAVHGNEASMIIQDDNISDKQQESDYENHCSMSKKDEFNDLLGRLKAVAVKRHSNNYQQLIQWTDAMLLPFEIKSIPLPIMNDASPSLDISDPVKVKTKGRPKISSIKSKHSNFGRIKPSFEMCKSRKKKVVNCKICKVNGHIAKSCKWFFSSLEMLEDTMFQYYGHSTTEELMPTKESLIRTVDNKKNLITIHLSALENFCERNDEVKAEIIRRWIKRLISYYSTV